MTAGYVDDVEDLVADIGRKTVVNILHHQDGIRTKASKNQNARDAQRMQNKIKGAAVQNYLEKEEVEQVDINALSDFPEKGINLIELK